MRPRVRSVGWIVLPFLLAFAGCEPPSDSTAGGDTDGPSGIVLITVDGLIPEPLTAFGGATPTPGFDALVAESSTWLEAWSAIPMTRPAVATLLTGIAPDRHGVVDDLFTSLDGEEPTLATELSRAGYRTAAFPDSWFLGHASGLLRGFDVVADPPAILVTPARWLPHMRDAAEIAEEFDTWLASVGEEERFFSWVHFSGLLVSQVRTINRRFAPVLEDGEEADAVPRTRTLAAVDGALQSLLESIAGHPSAADTLVIVAATSGDHCRADGGSCGPGFSLDDAASRAPVVVRWPESIAGSPRGGGNVWSPDVPATIADLAGLRLSDRAEGLSLLAEEPSDRAIYAFSWATRDQLGWQPLRAVRRPGSSWRSADDESAAALLAARAEPSRPTVPFDTVAPMLRATGIEPEPIAGEGREFSDPEARRAVTGLLTMGRFRMKAGRSPDARSAFGRILEIDPQNLAASLDLGQILSVVPAGRVEGRRVLGKALSLYPTDPGLLHWYAHTIWGESLDEAEKLLEAVLPYSSEASDVLYDLACSRSLAGDVERSADFLRRSIEAGYRDWSHMETDADLRNLRESGRYAEVLQEYR